MQNNHLEQLKKEYRDVPIPLELDFVVKKALKESGANSIRSKNSFKRIGIAAASTVTFVTLLTVGINYSPVFASTLSKVPVIGGIVEVLTLGKYTVNEDRFTANIEVPAIQGLANKALENSLNEKYLAEGKKLYQEFMAEMENMKDGQGNFAVDSGYIVKTETDKILSIGRYTLTVKASGEEKLKYDTIDKENEILITLPSLFKDNSYVEIISENIKSQMREQMKADESIIYWVDSQREYVDNFDKIAENQNFYINKEGKLVISFDEYEVAPGSMGVVEFIIPTEAISNILVSNEYIK